MLGGCGRDAADREYLAALRGDESGISREEQIAHLDRAIALAPERGEYWETRALHRVSRRDFAAARADLDRAIALADRPYLRFLRGLVRCQAGDYLEALPDFDAAIAGQPENTQFYRGRALALVAVGEPGRALVDARRLVELEPQLGTSHYARGMALAALGRHREAMADFDRALELSPWLVYPLEARATSRERLHDLAGAAADRAEAARLAEEQAGVDLYLDPFRY